MQKLHRCSPQAMMPPTSRHIRPFRFQTLMGVGGGDIFFITESLFLYFQLDSGIGNPAVLHLHINGMRFVKELHLGGILEASPLKDNYNLMMV